MSKKMQLPDAIMDCIAGGVLHYGGEPVTGFDAEDVDGEVIVTFVTAKGTHRGKADWGTFFTEAEAYKASMSSMDKSTDIYDMKGMIEPIG